MLQLIAEVKLKTVRILFSCRVEKGWKNPALHVISLYMIINHERQGDVLPKL